jgi:hypothetical protein
MARKILNLFLTMKNFINPQGDPIWTAITKDGDTNFEDDCCHNLDIMFPFH